MNHKIIIVALALLILSGILFSCKHSKADPVHPSSSSDTEPTSDHLEDGGIQNYSVKKEKILSENITSFYLKFTQNSTYTGELKDKCPEGWYTFSLKNEKENVLCTLKWSERQITGQKDTYEVNFEAKPDCLTKLQELIKDKNIGNINGYYQTNSALGTYFKLDILYESGETLNAFAEGGASVEPTIPLDSFVVFFDALAEEYNKQFVKAFLKPQEEW